MEGCSNLQACSAMRSFRRRCWCCGPSSCVVKKTWCCVVVLCCAVRCNVRCAVKRCGALRRVYVYVGGAVCRGIYRGKGEIGIGATVQ